MRKLLYWYVDCTFNKGDNGSDHATVSLWVATAAQSQMDNAWKKLSNVDLTLVAPNSWNQYKGLDDYTVEQMLQFDMIEICAPRQELNKTDAYALPVIAVYSPFLAPALFGCAFMIVEANDRFSISASSLRDSKIRRNVPSSRHLQNRLYTVF